MMIAGWVNAGVGAVQQPRQQPYDALLNLRVHRHYQANGPVCAMKRRRPAIGKTPVVGYRHPIVRQLELEEESVCVRPQCLLKSHLLDLLLHPGVVGETVRDHGEHIPLDPLPVQKSGWQE